MMSLDLFIKEWKIEFALGDIANGSQKIRQVKEHKTFFISPVNPRNSKDRKDAYGWVIP
jgi:hypothetical protein